MEDKPDYFQSPWEWYNTWLTDEDLRLPKTLRNKIIVCLAWFWFQLGAIADWFLNQLNERGDSEH